MLTKTIRNKKNKVFAFWIKTFFIVFVSISFLSLPSVVFGQNATYLTTSGANTFTLSQSARTSAGIFTVDSVLVRTLWSAVNYNAGTYRIEWDGKDDNGNQMPAGNYVAKVLANNVNYTWEGVLGNTSDNDTGSMVHHGMYYFMTGMTIANGSAYYCSGYSEGRASNYKFLTAKPQEKIDIIANANGTTTAETDFAVNDGTNVYWAGYDAYATANTFVYATKISDNSYVPFSNGVIYKPAVIGVTYNNAISYANQVNSVITGLAVQKAGNFLFVAREGLNQLSVLNKGTGQLLQTISVNAPKGLCVDMQDNLWMVTDSNTVAKYSVNANGTLSAPLLTISSVLTPIALAVSPDNTTIAIADGALSSQQVKAFSNLTGNPLWTLGTPGGYMQDATVNNNKFYFNDLRGQLYVNSQPGFRVFIAFQPDGSFWVNDPGNFRVQHYTANTTFIETVMATGVNYASWADKNDNTKVGSLYLEFKIDYSKPLTGSTGWQLVKNWGGTITSAYDPHANFQTVITLTSGGVSRTFGLLRLVLSDVVVELQSNNSLRFTGITLPHCNIDKDGSLLTDSYQKFAFQGFDNLNNPIWSKIPVQLVDLSIIQLNPSGLYIPQWILNSYVTTSGKVILYDYSVIEKSNPRSYNTGFHLGAIQQGGNSYLWQTAMATRLDYVGPFPGPGSFDIGNGVVNAGSTGMVLNRNIITGYHGEFWKANETNMYNHYLDNGLAIGQFGVNGNAIAVQAAPAGMAGNTLNPQLVYGNTADEMYLYHGDESQHGGVHQWRISGLSTITEQDIPITYPSPALAPIIVPGNNLMVNLPYDTLLVNNTSGWTFAPATQNITSNYQVGWGIRTSALSAAANDPDIYVKCYSPTGTFTINRDLGNNSGLLSWTLSGKISYYGILPTGAMMEYFDILDVNGKIIARISNQFTAVSAGNYTITNSGNNQILVSGPSTTVLPIMSAINPVQISAINNIVTINYAGYTVTAPIFDPTADISSPKTMRVLINGGANPQSRDFDFMDMKFTPAKTNQTINFNAVPATNLGMPAFPLIALSSSDLPVTFSVISGPATIIGNIITLTGSGKVVVQASQAGNSIYNAAPSVTQTFVVNLRTDL